jgi:hypothetical protein
MQTYGQWLVGTTFNPSGDAKVNEVKQATADLIDDMQEIASNRDHPGARSAALAITAYEEAAMWAVKAITKPERDLSSPDPIGDKLQEQADKA